MRKPKAKKQAQAALNAVQNMDAEIRRQYFPKGSAQPPIAYSETWQLSNSKMTVSITVLGDTVVEPVTSSVAKFVGQPLSSLIIWMTQHPGFLAKRLDGWSTSKKERCDACMNGSCKV